jgi:hypothetical protein
MRKPPAFKIMANSIENDFDEPIRHLNPVAPPSGRLIVKRNGHSITRQIPERSHPSISADFLIG